MDERCSLSYVGLHESNRDRELSNQTLLIYQLGERTPISGQYEVINSNGKSTGLEVTSTAGNPLPPTSESDQSYRLVDPTKHKKSNR